MLSENISPVQNAPSEAEVRRRVEANLGLVNKAAREAISRGSIEPYEDLYGAGCIGLVQAARSFDPSRGNKFSSLAMVWIRGKIRQYLRDKSGAPRVPRKWRELVTKYYNTPDVEAAKLTEVSVDEWRYWKQACTVWMVSWDDRAHDRPTDAPPEIDEATVDHAEVVEWLEAQTDEVRVALDKIFSGKGTKRDRAIALKALSESF